MYDTTNCMVKADPNTILPYHPLTAITPLDGRYHDKTQLLAPYVSEYSLIQTRIEIEAQYLIALSKARLIRALSKSEETKLKSLGKTLTLQQAEEVKKLEQQTRHDVKAMERIFRSLLRGTSLADVIEMIHIGLTSEDINNTSYRLMLKRATEQVIIPALQSVLDKLCEFAKKYKATPMLARTHGQAAVPTTIGKEFVVFAIRLHEQLQELKKRRLGGKLNGAVGNFNAISLIYPKTDWIYFSRQFIMSFGLIPTIATTQINTYEDIVSYFHNYQRIHGILIDLNQDIWRYISDNWFIQEVKKGEVGSSTMPQKVNPIDFENSEGNLTMANALMEGMSRKLSISRLQRDLSDSTVIRNAGTALGYSFVGYSSLIAGIQRIRPNIPQIEQDLHKDWSILSEAVQTVLRAEGISDPYSLLKNLTRGEKMTKEQWYDMIQKLPVTSSLQKKLQKITPSSYIGYATKICEYSLQQIQKETT